MTAAGIGRIGIVDFDTVDESNLQRQILYSSNEVGKPKTEKAKERLEALNPYVKFETYPVLLSAENALPIIANYEVVIDGSDNLPTRYLVNDACVLLGKTLLYGAIFQFEGQVSVFNQLLEDGTRGPNYRDLFPDPPPPEMVPSCSVGGVLGVLPGIIGSMQANEAIKVLAGIGETLSGRLLLFDSLNFTIHFINLTCNPTNPLSGKSPTIRSLIDYEEFCKPTSHKAQTVKEISAIEVKKMLNDGIAIQIIDVREPLEYGIVNIGGLNIPLKNLEENSWQVKRNIPVVVHCKSGGRSALAIAKLQQQGFTNLLNMTGGILRWINDVDNKLIKY